MPKPTLLRLDDPGASTKHFEQYAKFRLKFAGRVVPTPRWLNWGPLKRHGFWKGWGPYDELSAATWEAVIKLLAEYDAKMTIAVTAAWVEADGTLTPFATKFPDQTKVLRQAAKAGVIEIANHGLTHCVLKDRAYLPQRYRSNRKYHREFWEWVPVEQHRSHLKQSQELLQEAFASDIVTFVPPGNVWTENTERAATEVGLKFLSAAAYSLPTVPERNGIRFVSEAPTTLFHDREIAQHGVAWFRRLLKKTTGPYLTIREYCDDDRFRVD